MLSMSKPHAMRVQDAPYSTRALCEAHTRFDNTVQKVREMKAGNINDQQDPYGRTERNSP